jgi:hypothetical protein
MRRYGGFALLAIGCSSQVISFSTPDGGNEPPFGVVSGVGPSSVTTIGTSGTVGSGGSVSASSGIGGYGGGMAGSGVVAGSGGAAGSGGVAGSSSAGGAGGSADAGCNPPVFKHVVWNRAGVTDFDADGGPQQFSAVLGRWLLDYDMTGTASVSIEPCGTMGNGLHFKGSGNTAWGASVEAPFDSMTQPIDSDGSTGLAFTLRSTRSIIVSVQEPENVAAFCRCNDDVLGQDCHAGFSLSVAPIAPPVTVVLPWTMFRAPNFGYHEPGKVAVDPSQLVSLVFGVDQTAGDFDICIDDIRFTY